MALSDVIMWTETDAFSINSNTALDDFANYRRSLAENDHNDFAVLFTWVGLTSPLGFSGSICGQNPVSVVEIKGNLNQTDAAQETAIEIARSFGMRQYSGQNGLADKFEDFISKNIKLSSRSRARKTDYWKKIVHKGVFPCLLNRPKAFINHLECGNGFLEDAEECDCGPVEQCQNACCDARTCQLISTASCANGECCDLTTCQPHSVKTLCREAASECDMPEYCDGESTLCPRDLYRRNADRCNTGKAFCYNGTCPSRDDQCKLLWGQSAHSADQCYGLNSGAESPENIFCGRLHCDHASDGANKFAGTDKHVIWHGTNKVDCQTVTFESEHVTIDPGLVPDGSKCGEDKICLRQKCLPIEEIRSAAGAPECPNNCYGYGVCDNNGRCHCNPGFEPPSCTRPAKPVSHQGNTILGL